MFIAKKKNGAHDPNIGDLFVRKDVLYKTTYKLVRVFVAIDNRKYAKLCDIKYEKDSITIAYGVLADESGFVRLS